MMKEREETTMHKRMMKWIGMLLVLTMLIELVPAALPGGLTVQAAAVSGRGN